MNINKFLLICLASTLSACYAEPPPAVSGSVLGNVVNSGGSTPSTKPLIPDPPQRGMPLKVMGNTAFIDSTLPARFSETGGKIPAYYQYLNNTLSERNPELDAQAAIQQGERYLLIYTQSNPAAIPNKNYAMFITKSSGDPPLPVGQRKINCGLKYIQGMEASVDNKNSEMLAISQKLSIYGDEWNNVMWSVCQMMP